MKMKRIYKILFIILIVVLLAFSAIMISLITNDKNQNKLKHFYEKNVEMITNLSDEEQIEILELFNICIPAVETSAYINSFQKYYYGNDIYAYVVEFDGVNRYQNFYEANSNRIGKNGMVDISCNQLVGASSEQLLQSDFSKIGDGGTDYYLTYQLLIHKTENQQIPKLYEEYSSRRK